jgi:Flp pilus assembly secretin CpaC
VYQEPGNTGKPNREVIPVSIIIIGVVVGAVVVAYTHRVILKAAVEKEVAALVAEHASVITKAKADIATVIAEAKTEAAKVETTATAIVAKVEAKLKSVL